MKINLWNTSVSNLITIMIVWYILSKRYERTREKFYRYDVRGDNYNIWLHGTDTQYGDFSGYDVTSCVCLEVKEKLAHVS